jgi:hypothetical protein
VVIAIIGIMVGLFLPAVQAARDAARRLRRKLLKRHRKNPKRLSRNQRWPNAYFSELGLYSLVQAHARFVHQSDTDQVESRMRENRQYGSAGGGVSS